jgi:dienelactone hydrolase
VTLRVHAASALADAPVGLDIRGLRAGERATLRATWRADDGRPWVSDVAVRANADGTASLHGVDGARVLWGMRPTGPGPRDAGFFLPVRGERPVALAVVAGGRTVAQASLPRRVTTARVRVRRLTLRHDGLVGLLFDPPAGSVPHPAALVFGGSEGGNGLADVAGLLAAHGYPTLALAYFRAPGLPPRLARIPLEYFGRAARLLRAQPGVDRRHVLAFGASRGGEAALLVASTFPRLLHGAVALVPSAVVNPSPGHFDVPAWDYRGRPVPMEQIPIERISGPVLTAGAGLDAVWDSTTATAEVEQRLDGIRFRPVAADPSLPGGVGQVLGDSQGRGAS